MGSFTGITAQKANDVLGMSVVSGTINAQGHLILTRGNGQTIDAGDFTAIVTGILQSTVNTSVAAAVPNYVAGTVIDKGNISGALSLTDFTATTLVNGLAKGVMTGNVTLATSALPANPKPNTQFALKLQQDATGGRTLTLTGFKKSQGTLVLSTAPNDIDIVVFLFDGTNWYAGLMGSDFQ